MVHMKEGTLGALIEWLKYADQDAILLFGFGSPHSYRGYYEDLAFTPVMGAKVAYMLAHAKEALGKEFHGYKGGKFTMKESTDCWVATNGELGVPISRHLFRVWEDQLES